MLFKKTVPPMALVHDDLKLWDAIEKNGLVIWIILICGIVHFTILFNIDINVIY